MNYLLDTQVFLWWLNGDEKLKASVKKVIADPSNMVCVSIINAWEISIKLKTNPKFRLKTSIKQCFKSTDFEVLDVKLEHVYELEKLPLHHKDPFDRMLISQAKVDNLTLITSDRKIGQYKVSILKA